MRAGVRTSVGAMKTMGTLFLKITIDNSTTIFKIWCKYVKKKKNTNKK